MDNAQKAIMIGVGLFITIIVIAAVMLITGMGQDLLSSGKQEANNISANVQATLTQQFDSSVVSGSELLSIVKRYYKTENMIIIVNATGTIILGSGTGVPHNYGKVTYNGIYGSRSLGFYTTHGTKAYSPGDGPTPIAKLYDKSDTEYYVPPSAKYHVNLIRIIDDERGFGQATGTKLTDDVVGLVFQRKLN